MVYNKVNFTIGVLLWQKPVRFAENPAAFILYARFILNRKLREKSSNALTVKNGTWLILPVPAKPQSIPLFPRKDLKNA
jgi:hypothetical protein